MKNIFVTGGSGFIGSHTCLVLLERGYNVIALDSNINSSKISIDRVNNIFLKNKKNFSNKIKFIKGDVRSYEIVNNIFLDQEKEGNKIDGVIHFAGLKAVRESIEKPIQYWDNNVFGSLNILKIMKNFNCHNFIFSSSATIYGCSNSLLISENESINPVNPYGTTKATVEKLLEEIFYSQNQPWSICSLRYFNPIGSHYTGQIGENPSSHPNNIFPLINKVAAKQIDKLKIFGNDWDTPDGTCIRDYIHVMDVAEGHVSALEHLMGNNIPKKLFLNLGTGKGTSVLELLNIFQEENKINVPYEISSRREGDVARVVADNSKATSLLKWVPKRTIKEMCKDGWNWQVKNPSGY